MSTIEIGQKTGHGDQLAAALAGDRQAFTAAAERHRHELRVHCYRMLGSFEDSEDLVQETLLRAWKKRDSFQGRASFRAWLYGIATHGCLDFLEKNRHRVLVPDAGRVLDDGLLLPVHVPWLQPYPDRLLEVAAKTDSAPDAALVAKENIELAFLVTLQFLPPKQRAVLILCDVLDWSAKEAAELLELSVQAVNSALQRARATLREQQRVRGPEWKPDLDPDTQKRALLERYVDASERTDVQALAALLRDDARFSMPPVPNVYAGRDKVVKSWVDGGFGKPPFDDFRCLVTRANRMPAVACYVRKPGQTEHHPLALDVLEIEAGLVAEITTFSLESLLDVFALPKTL